MKTKFFHQLFLCLSFTGLLWSCTSPLDNPKTNFPAPTELKIEKISAAGVKITWKDNSNGEDGFVVERVVLGSKDTVKSTVGANVTEYEDLTLSQATYRFTVYAYYRDRKSGSVSANYQHIPVKAPENFQIADETGNSLSLSWDADNSAIDGFVIERKLNDGQFQVWQTLDKNTFSVVDNNLTPGTITYHLYSYSGDAKSEYIEKSIVFIAQPQLVLNSLVTSYFKLTPYITLTSNGGSDCTTGICWSTSPAPTISNQTKTSNVTISSGQSAYIAADNLLAGTTYYFRAFATNARFTTYSNEVSGQLAAEPSALSLTWTEMSTINSQLPAEIKVYETSSSLNGRNFKAYYAIADMSTGNIELKTIYSSTAKKPSAFVSAATDETVYIMTNGSYFGYNGSTAVSYGLVVDRGSKVADNIASLTRGTNVYSVTRGIFGVSSSQIPAIKWGVGNFSYNLPSQNVEGETPQPAASSTFPEASVGWSPYTAIGGAPVLMKDGKMTFDFTTTASGKYLTNYELLQTDIFATTVRPPRTLIGNTSDNKIILFICDGRQSFSDGATLTELAQIMKSLGCVNVLNLDGGGSTAMIAAGTLLNSPSDGTERAVASVVAFVKRK